MLGECWDHLKRDCRPEGLLTLGKVVLRTWEVSDFGWDFRGYSRVHFTHLSFLCGKSLIPAHSHSHEAIAADAP
jgi:hypothetical protein